MAEISRNVSTAASSPLKIALKKSSTINTPSKQSAKVSTANYNSVPRPNTAYVQVNLSSLSPAKQPSIQQQIQQRLPSKRDLAILHESKIFKSLLESAAKRKEEQEKTKRNPIMQDNNEEIQQFKPCFRRVESAQLYSSCADENVKRAKKTGDFNERYNPRPEEPKPQGIKAFVVNPPESRDEQPRRQLKSVRTKSCGRVHNPIVEGDAEGSIIKRGKKMVEKNDHHQRINDKKFLLPAERGCSPQGKIFRDNTVTIVGTDYSSVQPRLERQRSLPARPASAQEEKMRGAIKSILEYHEGPNFRDEVVSNKCTTIKFVDILKGHAPAEERVFARKTTLKY